LLCFLGLPLPFFDVDELTFILITFLFFAVFVFLFLLPNLRPIIIILIQLIY
jgi:hypothetical protein